MPLRRFIKQGDFLREQPQETESLPFYHFTMGIAEDVKKDLELKKRTGDPKARRGIAERQKAQNAQDRDGKSLEKTREDEENQDVDAMKEDIQSAKKETAESSSNAAQAAHRAEDVGQHALGRLGAQGEKIHETEKNVDLAESEGKVGTDNAAELERENRTMFARLRPRTKKSREKEERKILERHQQEREQREATRREASESHKRMEGHKQNVDKTKPAQDGAIDFGERSKYQFEPDKEDEKVEDEIDENLGNLQNATSRLGGLAKATGDEMNSQNRDIDRVAEKVSTPRAWGPCSPRTYFGADNVSWCRATKRTNEFNLTGNV